MGKRCSDVFFKSILKSFCLLLTSWNKGRVHKIFFHWASQYLGLSLGWGKHWTTLNLHPIHLSLLSHDSLCAPNLSQSPHDECVLVGIFRSLMRGLQLPQEDPCFLLWNGGPEIGRWHSTLLLFPTLIFAPLLSGMWTAGGMQINTQCCQHVALLADNAVEDSGVEISRSRKGGGWAGNKRTNQALNVWNRGMASLFAIQWAVAPSGRRRMEDKQC